MKYQIQLFAAARDAAGAGVVEVNLPDGANVAALRQALVQSAPGLAHLARVLWIAVDGEYAADQTQLPITADIAAFPPVSGG